MDLRFLARLLIEHINTDLPGTSVVGASGRHRDPRRLELQHTVVDRIVEQ